MLFRSDVGREFRLLRRHREVLVVVADRLKEKALRVAGDYRRAGVTAFKDPRFQIEAEAGAEALRVGGVALVTVGAEYGLDFFAEELVAGVELRRGVGGKGEAGAGERDEAGEGKDMNARAHGRGEARREGGGRQWSGQAANCEFASPGDVPCAAAAF